LAKGKTKKKPTGGGEEGVGEGAGVICKLLDMTLDKFLMLKKLS
jgi:hypothetical protein